MGSALGGEEFVLGSDFEDAAVNDGWQDWVGISGSQGDKERLRNKSGQFT